ncbi:hypothetical protein IFM89_000073 [Coptis chinensis]|uniref:Cytochrome P450 n=1 Tax=Coptis chinensis TaxID=261450 RepID=A0A835M8X5_9MAGN|nr:hypothetical protein IFM89_000073 [Coptis chinensis]
MIEALNPSQREEILTAVKNASEKKPINTSFKADEKGYEPFSRRCTKSRNHFVSNPFTEASKKGHVASRLLESGEGNGVAGVAGTTNVAVLLTGLQLSVFSRPIGCMQQITDTRRRHLRSIRDRNRYQRRFQTPHSSTPAEVSTSHTQTYTVVWKLVDTTSLVDQGTMSNSLHNFNLPISLAVLKDFGGLECQILLWNDTLPDGFSVKKDDLESYQPYAMGRMKYIWGEDAEEYHLERWIDEDGKCCMESPFKFPAFQAGPRICAGKEFAFSQMKVFTSVLLHFFAFELWDNKKLVNYKTMITLHIDGPLNLRASPRV